jgi:Diacylglycerol acyltransferase
MQTTTESIRKDDPSTTSTTTLPHVSTTHDIPMDTHTSRTNSMQNVLHNIFLFINVILLTPMWTMTICIGLYVTILYVAIYIDPTNLLLTIHVLYTVYLWSDRRYGPSGYKQRRSIQGSSSSSPSQNFRNWSCFRYMASYFPISLHKTSELHPQQQPYLFLYQPHGIIAMGVNAAINTNGCSFDTLFPGIVHYGVTLDVPFYVPFLRDWLIALGFVHAQTSTLERLLRNDRTSVVLVPGGAYEALYTQPHTFRCISKTACIRLALATGATIVPCIGLGENNAFRVHSFPVDSAAFRLQQWVCQCVSFSTPILTSPFVQRRPIQVIIGSPVQFPNNIRGPMAPADITTSLVLQCQTAYIAAVEQLYHTHQDQCGHANVPLEWIPSLSNRWHNVDNDVARRSSQQSLAAITPK